MSLSAVHEEAISMNFGPITSEHIKLFASATVSENYVATPLTFPTIFRATEFRWLDRLQLDMRQLLHTEQEYEYIAPLREGDTLLITTRMTGWRQRKGLLFVTMESDVTCIGKTVIKATSAFVVRQDNEAPAEGGN